MLHVDLPPVGLGGVAYQVHLLAENLVRLGHEVDVFTTHGIPEDRPYRVLEVKVGGTVLNRKVLGTALAYRNIDLSGYDLVHAHGDDWAIRSRGTPIVRTFYGSAIMEAWHATSWRRRGSQVLHYGLEWVSALRADEAVAISRHTSRCLPLARTRVPCAFDPAVFFPGGNRTRHPSLLAVAGLLGGRKRGSLLIASFQQVRRQIPTAELVIVTRDSVAVPGVRCLGNVSAVQLGKLFRRSWALCSASSYEGFGVPYLEALASGLPVVTTRNPGAEEILDDGRLGIVCHPGDLSGQIIRILNDGSVRERLSQAGPEAASELSAKVVAAHYEKIFQRVIASRLLDAS